MTTISEYTGIYKPWSRNPVEEYQRIIYLREVEKLTYEKIAEKIFEEGYTGKVVSRSRMGQLYNKGKWIEEKHDELLAIQDRIDRMVSSSWKDMLKSYCIKKDPPTIDRESLDFLNINTFYNNYLKNGYKNISSEYILKYYKENKDALYLQAIHLLFNDAFLFERKYNKQIFIDYIPYPLPDKFDFTKNNVCSLINNKNSNKKDNDETMSCIDALAFVPENLLANIVGSAAAASEIALLRQTMMHGIY